MGVCFVHEREAYANSASQNGGGRMRVGVFDFIYKVEWVEFGSRWSWGSGDTILSCDWLVRFRGVGLRGRSASSCVAWLSRVRLGDGDIPKDLKKLPQKRLKISHFTPKEIQNS